jgi:hypothetical protein
VTADASRERRVPGDAPPERWQDPENVSRPVREYLQTLDREAGLGHAEFNSAPKYLSETDPAAAWSVKGGAAAFGYETNYLLDSAGGVIVDVEATPARLSQEIIAAKTMIDRTEDCFALKAKRLAADMSYGTGSFLTWLMEKDVEPHIPVLDRSKQTDGKLTREHFTFDAGGNFYTCPAGKRLSYRGKSNTKRIYTYCADPQDCGSCALRQQCTSGPARKLGRHWDEEVREAVKALAGTEAFARSSRERKKVEMRFADMKRHLGIRRLKLRGLKGADEEFTLAAADQNIKTLIKHAFPPGGPSTAVPSTA